MDRLMDKNNEGMLTAGERDQLQALVSETQELALANIQELALANALGLTANSVDELLKYTAVLAMSAGPEMDALAAERILGLKLLYDYQGSLLTFLPACSTSMDGAMMLVNALSARGCGLILEDWRNLENAPAPWAASFDLPDGHDTGHAMGQTAAEAACKACLLTSCMDWWKSAIDAPAPPG